MSKKLVFLKAIIFTFFSLSFVNAKADKEASLFELDLTDSLIVDTSKYLPVFVFDSLRAEELVPFQLPYSITYKKEPKKRKKLKLEKKLDSLMTQERLKRRSVYNLAFGRPELIDFIGLGQFDKSLNNVNVQEMDIHVKGVDIPQLLPGLFTVEQQKKKKENKIWASKGNISIQFSQYYVTDNWHKGGTPNATFLTIFDYDIVYNKNRWLWENEFDVKLGFYNTHEDTIRAFRVNNDVTKASSRIGYQSKFTKKLYYSVGMDFNTSMLKGYKKTNSNEVVTSFLSPTRIFFSTGLDYRHSKNTTVRVSPVAYKVIFLMPNTEVNPLSVGLDSSQYHTGYPGYMIQAKLNWKFSREVQITSDFDLFSSYNCRNIEFDWETIGKFTINRFLSTRLSLIMRFDNTPKDEDAKIQIQEQLSFGFSYHFQ